MTTRFGLVLAVPLCLVLLFGCDGKVKNAPASVSGKVTYKGATVGGGNIRFFTPDDGSGVRTGSYSAKIDSNGNYSAGDVPVGELDVTIETESINPSRTKMEYQKGGQKGNKSPPPPGAQEPQEKGTYVAIPKKYADVKTSKLKATLKSGKNTQNFELTD